MMRRIQVPTSCNHRHRHRIHFWKDEEEEQEEESRNGVDDIAVSGNDKNSDSVYRFVDESPLPSSNNGQKKIRFIRVTPLLDQISGSHVLNFQKISQAPKDAKTQYRNIPQSTGEHNQPSSFVFPANSITAPGHEVSNDSDDDNDEFAILESQSLSFWTSATSIIENTFTDNTFILPKPTSSTYWVRLTPTFLSGIMATSIDQSNQSAQPPTTKPKSGTRIVEKQPTVVAYVRLWEIPETTSSSTVTKSRTLCSIPLPTMNYFHDVREKHATTSEAHVPQAMKDLYAVWAQPQNALYFPVQLSEPTEDSVVDSDAILPVFVKLEVGVVVHGDECPFGLLVLDVTALVDGRRSHTVQVTNCLQVPDCPVFRKRMVSFQDNKQGHQQKDGAQLAQSFQQQVPMWLYELGKDSEFHMQLVTQQCPRQFVSSQQRKCNWNPKSLMEKSVERLWKSKSFDSMYSKVLSPAQQYSTVGASWCGCNASSLKQPKIVELDQADENAQTILDDKDSFAKKSDSSFYTIVSQCTDATIPSSESKHRGICQSPPDTAIGETLWQDEQIPELSIELLYKESSQRQQKISIRSLLGSKLNGFRKSKNTCGKLSSSKTVSWVFESANESELCQSERQWPDVNEQVTAMGNEDRY